jgi:AcrR family transcriptional regulator
MAPIVTEEHKENRRKKILESALVCFAEKGFEAATIDDIVAHSGISKGSIYNYFKTKDDIYVQLMNEYTHLNFEHFKKSFRDLASVKEKIHCLFDLYKNAGGKEKAKHLLLVHGEFFLSSSRKEENHTLVIERYRNVYKRFLIDLLESGKKTGEISSTVNSDIAASFFWTMIDGICLDHAVLGANYPFSGVFEKAEEVFFQMIQ